MLILLLEGTCVWQWARTIFLSSTRHVVRIFALLVPSCWSRPEYFHNKGLYIDHISELIARLVWTHYWGGLEGTSTFFSSAAFFFQTATVFFNRGFLFHPRLFFFIRNFFFHPRLFLSACVKGEDRWFHGHRGPTSFPGPFPSSQGKGPWNEVGRRHLGCGANTAKFTVKIGRNRDFDAR